MEAALQRMDGWIDRDPEHPVARLRAEHGLTSRLVLALWILLIDRLDCGDEHVGISLQALLGMVGLHQPGTAAPLLERFGREGPSCVTTSSGSWTDVAGPWRRGWR